jgi:hypothetical protein
MNKGIWRGNTAGDEMEVWNERMKERMNEMFLKVKLK